MHNKSYNNDRHLSRIGRSWNITHRLEQREIQFLYSSDILSFTCRVLPALTSSSTVVLTPYLHVVSNLDNNTPCTMSILHCISCLSIKIRIVMLDGEYLGMPCQIFTDLSCGNPTFFGFLDIISSATLQNSGKVFTYTMMLYV